MVAATAVCAAVTLGLPAAATAAGGPAVTPSVKGLRLDRAHYILGVVGYRVRPYDMVKSRPITREADWIVERQAVKPGAPITAGAAMSVGVRRKGDRGPFVFRVPNVVGARYDRAVNAVHKAGGHIRDYDAFEARGHYVKTNWIVVQQKTPAGATLARSRPLRVVLVHVGTEQAKWKAKQDAIATFKADWAAILAAETEFGHAKSWSATVTACQHLHDAAATAQDRVPDFDLWPAGPLSTSHLVMSLADFAMAGATCEFGAKLHDNDIVREARRQMQSAGYELKRSTDALERDM
jgi:hypothetical protein